MLTEKIRELMLTKTLKNAKTSFVPLSRIRSAAVYLSETSFDCAKTINEINRFFASKNIPVNIYAFALGPSYLSEGVHKATFIHKKNLGFAGKVKNRFLRTKINLNADLVINLTDELFAADYCVAATKAKFRIGRYQISNQMYNLICSEPANKRFNELQVFKYIADLLTKIK